MVLIKVVVSSIFVFTIDLFIRYLRQSTTFYKTLGYQYCILHVINFDTYIYIYMQYEERQHNWHLCRTTQDVSVWVPFCGDYLKCSSVISIFIWITPLPVVQSHEQPWNTGKCITRLCLGKVIATKIMSSCHGQPFCITGPLWEEDPR